MVVSAIASHRPGRAARHLIQEGCDIMTGFSARASSLALAAGILAGLSGMVVGAVAGEVATVGSTDRNCSTVGRWIDPATGAILAHDRLIERASSRSVVLLGETHPNVDHHRWQLSVIAGLYGRNPDMVLGFEAFPRKVQPVLDRWVEGELSEEAFLRESDWSRNWGFDPELYLPLFHFARLYNVPMVALNVERSFVSRVRDQGLDAIPEDERRGLTEPAPPSDAYLDSLAEIYSQHPDGGGPAALDLEDEAAEATSDDAEAVGDETPKNVRDDPDFQRFVRVQTIWDRAMAEALVEARSRDDDPLVVGIVGSGHLERGFGVPYQLDDLEMTDAAVFLPVSPSDSCEPYEDEVADALMVLPPLAEVASGPPRPRLGVMIETVDNRVEVLQVVDDSVAASADIRDGDAILQAAGVALTDTAGLIGIVQRQAPGTWLPLEIERDGETIEIVAKFPAQPADHTEP